MDTSAASLVAREEALARMEARVAIRNQAAVMLEAKVAVAHKAALELQKLAQDGVEDARRTYEETAQEKRDIHTLTRNLDDKRNAERGGIDNEWQRVQAEWAKIEVERTRVMDQMRKVLSKSLQFV
ncbi:hypothetical protein BC828DRAFT_409890 [Blastocladiella britannica]|nr:hypothetical protein BC828DRAFT_409890 [Blastocladiella britannica]